MDLCVLRLSLFTLITSACLKSGDLFGVTGWEEEGNKGPSVGHKYPGIVQVFLARRQAPAKVIGAKLIKEGAMGVKNRALNSLRKYSDEV